MGIFEPITHSEETKRYLSNAETIFNNAKARYEKAVSAANDSIKELGAMELRAWGTDIHGFISAFSIFAHAEESKYSPAESELFYCKSTPNEITTTMKNYSFEANELLKIGTLAVGTGVIAGIAAYGALSSISGGAAAAATGVATRSGVALSSTAKSLIIGGAVVAPILIFGAVLANIKGKEKLAEAKKIYADAEKHATDLDMISEQLEAIYSMSNKYMSFIEKIGNIMRRHTAKIVAISNSYPRIFNDKVDYNKLSLEEQETLHIGWLLACTYCAILKSPLLNSKGTLNNNAEQALLNCDHDLKILKKKYIKDKTWLVNFVIIAVCIILIAAVYGALALAILYK